MYITAELLEQHGACEEGLSRFVEIWPNGVELTVENIYIARQEQMSVSFLRALMPEAKYKSYRKELSELSDKYYRDLGVLRRGYWIHKTYTADEYNNEVEKLDTLIGAATAELLVKQFAEETPE